MNMARSTFYKRPNAEHAGGREKADADLRVRNLSTTMGHSTGLIREQCPVW